jgi:MYXO-CTERM domain-containing protein
MAPGEDSTAAGPGTNTGTNANGVSQNNNSGAGCSIGHTPASSSAGFASLLFGLVAFALRRRR